MFGLDLRTEYGAEGLVFSLEQDAAFALEDDIDLIIHLVLLEDLVAPIIRVLCEKHLILLQEESPQLTELGPIAVEELYFSRTFSQLRLCDDLLVDGRVNHYHLGPCRLCHGKVVPDGFHLLAEAEHHPFIDVIGKRHRLFALAVLLDHLNHLARENNVEMS